MRSKKSLLVIYKIVRLLFNKLSADDKHYLLNRDNLRQAVKMQLSKKQKSFSHFFLDFQNLYQILHNRHKNMTLIGDLFSEKLAPKIMV